MKILIINSVIGIGSTGRICLSLAEKFANEGHEVVVAYGRCDKKQKEKIKRFGHRIGSWLGIGFHFLATRLFDLNGFASSFATKKLVKWIDNFKPDLIWMHNLHGYYINIEILFNYLKLHPEIQKKWTLHDCWPITGHCAYFEQNQCLKWKECCGGCPAKKDYPKTLFLDKTKSNLLRKKECFVGVNNLTLITPSAWLKKILKQSFLKEYTIEIKYNLINKDIFVRRNNSFKQSNGFEDKIIVLGVANIWEKRKGFSEFVKLSTMIGDNFVILIVGSTTKRQIKELQLAGFKLSQNNKHMRIYKPDISIASQSFNYRPIKDIGIAIKPNVFEAFFSLTGLKYHHDNQKHFANCVVLVDKTNNANELVDLYSASDVMFNPTFDENYPTVILEALSTGLKVISYDTGGCNETINNFRKGEIYEK